MANNKTFKIKNGLSAGRYLGSNGTETAGTVGYNIGSAEYDGVSFDITQSTVTHNLTFKPDGTKMYVVERSNDSVYQYSLSTAYDVSTASYDSKSFSFATQEIDPYGIVFNDDGTSMYTIGYGSDAVYQYTLSTAYDVSTASYASKSLDVSSEDTIPTNVTFKADGTSLYIIGSSNDAVYQYNLTTAFDVSTGSYASKSLDFSSEDTNANGFAFNADGTKCFVVGNTSDKVHQYSLTTAYDISTASYDSVSFDLSSQDTNPFGLAFSNDGTKMYVLGSDDFVYQYSTALLTQTLDLSTGNTFSFTPSGATDILFSNPPASGTAVGFTLEVNNTGGYALTWPSSVKWPSGTAPTATASKELYTFVTTDGGTTYYGKLAGSDIA